MQKEVHAFRGATHIPSHPEIHPHSRAALRHRRHLVPRWRIGSAPFLPGARLSDLPTSARASGCWCRESGPAVASAAGRWA